jgi:chromosome segregation ATPase
MNRKLIFVVCLIGSFIATGLYAETLDSMKRNLEKLKGEQTRLEEKIFTAEKELARIGSEQSKKMAEIKRYEDETAKARDVITKLKEIQPDYSKELSRRRAELKKDFEGPDGLIPEEKRTAYMEAFDQLPKNYTKQMWEKDAADLNSAKHAVTSGQRTSRHSGSKSRRVATWKTRLFNRSLP